MAPRRKETGLPVAKSGLGTTFNTTAVMFQEQGNILLSQISFF